jgi:peptidoglycan/LPS O-acetylase OafA/YrhL
MWSTLGSMTTGAAETSGPAPGLSNMLDMSAALITAGLLAVTYLGESGLLRIMLALGFVFFVPGRAIVTNWPRMANWSAVAMPVVLSLALLTLATTVTLWAHTWRPIELFQVEAWPSAAGLCLALARRNRNPPEHQNQTPKSRR